MNDLMSIYGLDVVLSDYSGQWSGGDGRRWSVDLDAPGAVEPTAPDYLAPAEKWDEYNEAQGAYFADRHLGRITAYSDGFAAYPPEGSDGFSSGRAWCESRDDAVRFLALQHLTGKLDFHWERR